MKQHSLSVLAVGVLIGLLFPNLANFCRPMLGPAVFVFLFGTFLTCEPTKLRAAFASVRTSVIFPISIILLTPVLLALVLTNIELEASLIAAIVLTAACPPSAANAPMAVALGGDHATALVIILICTLLSPITIPIIAANWLDLQISAVILSRNVSFFVLGSGVLAITFIWFAKPIVNRANDGLNAMVTAALVVFAIGCMDGVQGQILNNPELALTMLTIAFAINITSIVAGVILGQGGKRNRLTYGLPFGNRNVGLVWAALGSSVDPMITFYFALSQVPIFTMPTIFNRALD